jgi:hypothetical protein
MIEMLEREPFGELCRLVAHLVVALADNAVTGTRSHHLRRLEGGALRRGERAVRRESRDPSVVKGSLDDRPRAVKFRPESPVLECPAPVAESRRTGVPVAVRECGLGKERETVGVDLEDRLHRVARLSWRPGVLC